jgi:hypothetical protein
MGRKKTYINTYHVQQLNSLLLLMRRILYGKVRTWVPSIEPDYYTVKMGKKISVR